MRNTCALDPVEDSQVQVAGKILAVHMHALDRDDDEAITFRFVRCYLR
jgi:hypothetical protein